MDRMTNKPLNKKISNWDKEREREREREGERERERDAIDFPRAKGTQNVCGTCPCPMSSFLGRRQSRRCASGCNNDGETT